MADSLKFHFRDRHDRAVNYICNPHQMTLNRFGALIKSYRLDIQQSIKQHGLKKKVI